jgi:hypothetical protein
LIFPCNERKTYNKENWQKKKKIGKNCKNYIGFEQGNSKGAIKASDVGCAKATAESESWAITKYCKIIADNLLYKLA